MEFYVMSLLDNEWNPCDYCNTMTKAITQLQWYQEMDKETNEEYEYAIMVVDNDRREEYMIYDMELFITKDGIDMNKILNKK